jgi:hypothetical protein
MYARAASGESPELFRPCIFFILTLFTFVSALVWVWLSWPSGAAEQATRTCALALTAGDPPCFQHTGWMSWLARSAWIPVALPCELRLPIRVLSDPGSRFCLDKYRVWELAALCQTAAIAIMLILEVRDGPHLRRVFFALLLVIVFGYGAVEMMLSNAWQWQLIASLIFFIAMAAADLMMWFREDDMAQQTKVSRHLYQEDLLWKTFILADMPMIVSNTILLGFLALDASEAHQILYAGATAFGLIFANMLIVLLRIWDIILRSQHQPAVANA